MPRLLPRPPSLRRALATACAAAAVAGLPAQAGVPMRDPLGRPVRWALAVDQPNVQDGVISWWIGNQGSTEEPLGDATELDALTAAFETWESVPGSRPRFRRDPARQAVDRDAGDRVNYICWDGYALGPYTLAATYTSASNGNLTDADIVFNDRVDFVEWATTAPGSPGRVDIQSVATHEIGHFLGLDHSPVTSATMAPEARAGSISQRSLEPDDEGALLEAYPPSGPQPRGSIVGTVEVRRRRHARGVPVFALDAVTGEPAGCGFTDDAGTFRILALPPGPYLVAAAPLSTTLPYSVWWRKAPMRLEAACLADPPASKAARDGSEATARLVEVRAGYPQNAGGIRLRRARRRGTGEPDDSPAEARPVGIGTAVAGNFEHPLDEDWFRFASPGTDPVEVRVLGWGIGSAADADMAIFDASGSAMLASDTDRRPALDPENALGDAGVDLDPAVESFVPPAAGDYLVRVRAQPGSGWGRAGAFYLLHLIAR